MGDLHLGAVSQDSSPSLVCLLCRNACIIIDDTLFAVVYAADLLYSKTMPWLRSHAVQYQSWQYCLRRVSPPSWGREPTAPKLSWVVNLDFRVRRVTLHHGTSCCFPAIVHRRKIIYPKSTKYFRQPCFPKGSKPMSSCFTSPARETPSTTLSRT